MKCDCGDGCRTCTGVAAWRAKREDGNEANLCTRCNLSSDTIVARLYDEGDIGRLVEVDAGRSINDISKVCDDLMDAFGGIGVLLRARLTLPQVAA